MEHLDVIVTVCIALLGLAANVFVFALSLKLKQHSSEIDLKLANVKAEIKREISEDFVSTTKFNGMQDLMDVKFKHIEEKLVEILEALKGNHGTVGQSSQ